MAADGRVTTAKQENKTMGHGFGKGTQKPEGIIVKEKGISHRKSLRVLRFWARGNIRLLLRSLLD